jgi:hypothetical protein
VSSQAPRRRPLTDLAEVQRARAAWTLLSHTSLVDGLSGHLATYPRRPTNQAAETGVTSTRPGLSTEDRAFDAALNGSCLLLFSVGSLARASSAFDRKEPFHACDDQSP